MQKLYYYKLSFRELRELLNKLETIWETLAVNVIEILGGLCANIIIWLKIILM